MLRKIRQNKFYRFSCFLGFKLIMAVLFLFSSAEAGIINLEFLKMIESSGNPLAFNSRTKCYGLYQISNICLRDFNQICKKEYKPEDLFNPLINETIAAWYITRIKQMLNFYGIPVSVTTIIASYNWGIGNVLKWHQKGACFKLLPQVTKKFIRKYLELTRENKT